MIRVRHEGRLIRASSYRQGRFGPWIPHAFVFFNTTGRSIVEQELSWKACMQTQAAADAYAVEEVKRLIDARVT